MSAQGAVPDFLPISMPIYHGRRDSLLTGTTGGAIAMRNALNVAPTDPAYLRNRINTLYNANPIGINPEGYYVPDQELEKLLDNETIEGALGGGVDVALVKFVLEKTPKTFATLQLVFPDARSRKMAIQAFQNRDFADEKLESKDLVVCKSSPCQRSELQAIESCSHFFPHSMPWDEVSLSQFKGFRWKFLVPTFNHHKFWYEFDPQRLLPFRVRGDSTKPSSGNFSDVMCVDMLADKQTILSPLRSGTITVAHKTLRPLDVPRYDIHTEWFREAEAHKQLNGISRHLVKGIAAYHRVANSTANSTYHIVLEWADGGNLFSYWSKDGEPQLTEDIAESRKRTLMLLEQLHGLAHALECMHNKHNKTAASSAQSSRSLPRVQHTNSEGTSTGKLSVPSVNVEAPPEDSSGQAQHSDPVIPRSSSQDTARSQLHPVTRHHSRRASDAKNWRHGDIKPENILRFTEGDDLVWLGTLKLADLGRAQQHDDVTALRSTIEKERWRTRWYEPPDLSEDLHQQAHGKISRLFDIWSMGCVIFESIIWLLYGSSEIARFQKIETHTAATPYWRKIRTGNYQVTERASMWIEHIVKHDVKQASAIGDLMKLVRDRLLIVDLPPDSDEYMPGKRTNAKNMKEELERICKKSSLEPEYLFNSIEKYRFSLPPGEISTPVRQFGTFTKHLSVPGGHRTRIEKEREYHDPMIDDWQYLDDHHFVERMINDDQIPSDDELCDHCKAVNVTSPELVFDRSDLEANCEQCVLCELISKAIDGVEFSAGDQIRLQREFDCFVACRSDGSRLKLLRLCCPDQRTSDSQVNIPVGAPHLYNTPETPKASDSFMRLPSEWLNECDRNHGATCEATHDEIQLPARLVDIRGRRPKIVDSGSIVPASEGVRYIAFSHKWGEMPDFALTTKTNLPTRRKGISSNEIPTSFADVIKITKALRCGYLWIDCLCINQGQDGDFAEQADSMQAVFSNAYCVIAAASAEGVVDGFLKRDPQSRPLDAVKVGSIYFSAVTNDFERDVLQSPLNSRGWVLQERALARRTIFFTANQMYWECGDGIRCETLRKLKHDEISFLGDAHFPSKTIGPGSTRGGQIRLWTALFEQYTRLHFSHKEDRSVGIQGLMNRLTSTFKTRSYAGLFESFWGRCMLWQRAPDGPTLTWIPPGEHTKKLPPSWSWMALHGPIKFLQPKGGDVDWNKDVVLPFPKRALGSSLQPNPQHMLDTNDNVNDGAIRATAYNIKAGTGDSNNTSFSYDDGRKHIDGTVRCVIVATTKDKAQHYILLILPAVHTTSATHERVGAGYLSEDCIDRASGTDVSIG